MSLLCIPQTVDNVQRNFIVRNLKEFLVYRFGSQNAEFHLKRLSVTGTKKKSNNLEVKNSIMYILYLVFQIGFRSSSLRMQKNVIFYAMVLTLLK